MGQKAAGTRRPRAKTTNPPPIQTKDMFTRTSTTLRAAALVALAVLACLATGASAQSRRLQGGAPYFNANFGGGIGKLFGAATNDFMQGGVGAVTDAAVNSYHEVVPPAHFRSSSAAALCRTTTRFTPHRRGTSAAADPWVCGLGAREAPARRQPCSLAKQVFTPSHPTSQSTTPTQKAIPSRTAVDQLHCQWASII